jgi:transcriptional regulator with XRE-family HTH domain
MGGELQKRVGRAVRRIRRGRGLSQEQLGDQIGMHRTYVGIVERGERNLSLGTVEEIAARLDVEPDELLRPEP